MALLNRPADHAVSPEAGDGEFQALLDIWFPEKQPLPTAFLVDTSEEALLLPDWLKLRMIRSEVPRLVDAGKGWAASHRPSARGTPTVTRRRRQLGSLWAPGRPLSSRCLWGSHCARCCAGLSGDREGATGLREASGSGLGSRREPSCEL